MYSRASWLLNPLAGPHPTVLHQRRGLQAVQGAEVKVTDGEATLALDRDAEDRAQGERGERAGRAGGPGSRRGLGQPRQATGQEGKVGRMTQIITEKQKLLVGPSGAAVGKELRSAGVTEAEPRRPGTGCIGHVGSREQAEFRQRASPHHLLLGIWRKQQSVRVIHTLHCIPPQSAPDAIGQTW